MYKRQAYYEWSGGKAFLGIDSLANYIIVASVQTGNDIYKLQDGQVTFSFDQDLARILWDELYVPYVKGYYANLGKFRSDDEKTGDILAYVGSSAGAVYFPKEVTLNQNEIYRIESSVLPYPCFRDGDLCAMVQGAGFSIAQSDSTHEYASAVFLKWLTQEEQNLDFAVNSGYLPVENSSLNQGYAKAMAAYSGTPEYNPTIGGSAEATLKMLSEYRFYSNPPFEGSYEMRQFYGEYMEASVDNARLEAEDKMKAGMTKEEAQAQVTDEAHFQEWYEGWQDNAAKLLGS